jgi:hypothetical protein
MGIPLPGTTSETKTVNSPGVDNREFTLALGQSVTQTTSTTSTILAGAGQGTVTTAQVSTTHTFEARETIMVLNRSFETCRYRVTSADSPGATTIWFIVGKGIPARSVTDGQTLSLKSGTYNGVPL